MKKELHLIGSIVATMLMVLMIVLVFFLLSAKLSADGTTRLGSYQLMVVLSGSMSPQFEAGDVIVVAAQHNAQYRVGDVITFEDPQDGTRVITHRVVEIIPEGSALQYRTKGDANDAADPLPVPAENVIGRQVWNIPYFGWVVEFAKTKQGIVALIIAPSLAVIVNEFRGMVILIREEELKRQRELEQSCQREVEQWYSRD